jgi:farnesyl-diphosphate farnesyltransferase
VETLKDWDEYCHYVAGLVGIGLSDLWVGSLLENEQFAKEEALSNSMAGRCRLTP